MEHPDFMAYFEEIERQRSFALSGLARLKNALGQFKELHYALNKLNVENKNYNSMEEFVREMEKFSILKEGHRHFHNEVFREIDSFLTHAAHLSNWFWPGDPKQGVYTEKAKELRRLFALSSSDGTLKAQPLSNYLEDYDKGVFAWGSSSNACQGSEFNCIGSLPVAEKEQDSVLRRFDPDTFNFLFLGKVYDLAAIGEALEELPDLTKSRMPKMIEQHQI